MVAILLAATTAFAQKSTKTQHIVYISIDGYRWKELFRGPEWELLVDKKYNAADSAHQVKAYWANTAQERRAKLMPFTWNYIARNGQLYGNRDSGNLVNVRNPYWISYPGRSESITGFADPAVKSNGHPDNQNDNVFEFLNKQKGFQGKIVTFASWDAVARIVNRNRNGMLVNIPGEDVTGKNLSAAQILANEVQHLAPPVFGAGERLDVNTYEIAKAYIQAQHPRVVYLDLADTDEYGHDGQYDKYLSAIHSVDAMIGNLWNDMQKDPFYKDKTTFIIIPDHGRGDGDQWTDHYSNVPNCNNTWMMVLGPDTPSTGEVSTKTQIWHDQFAQTLANLLGYQYSSQQHSVGNAVKSVFK